MPTTTATVKTTIPDHHPMVNVLGTGDELLKLVEQAFDVNILVRGNDITVTGEPATNDKVVHLFGEFVKLLDRGQGLDESNVTATIAMVQRAEHPSPAEVLSDEALTHRGRSIRPKTLGQKTYLDAIRKNTVVFGIGPAGTGKTYLAMAMAVLALKRKDVNRIILTRPAVEAGERLGFLPGTLFEKIDPYLRPLFDALYDMMDAEQIQLLMERGTIEVAPLAFMRGRAQPVASLVATPDGFRPIGSLQVGDLVIGSDGRPTAVLGVFPQGRKQVYRVATQDGASTLACAEHLWAVYTPQDRRGGKPARAMQTGEMIGQLRSHHQPRYELPLVQPIEFAPRDVPLDPYELGLAVGRGHAERFRGHEQLHSARGATAVASAPSRISADYLCSSPAVRTAVLQGVLDASASITSGPAARIICPILAPEHREAVIHLVRSLGGVALCSQDGSLVIQLPAHVQPFRLARKAALYERDGGGRPLRFITSIEPEGEAETVCIQVAAADSLYVTDDFLLTHNTINDSFIVLDEAQNTTPEQMKMFLTRLGFGSKAVVTGDVTQVDLPSGRHSGLSVVRNILTDIDGVAFIELGARDVVRHRIVQEIVEAYAIYDDNLDSRGQGK